MHQVPEAELPVLPNGWECRLDPLTQKFYFIDHNRQATQWKHPVTDKIYMPSGNRGVVVECPQTTRNQVHHKIQPQQPQPQPQPQPHENQRNQQVEEQEKEEPTQRDLSVVNNVLEKVHRLQPEVESFTGTNKDKEYTRLTETLEQLILQLDAVDPQGREHVRTARKAAVIEIQSLMSKLDSKSRSPPEEPGQDDTTTTGATGSSGYGNNSNNNNVTSNAVDTDGADRSNGCQAPPAPADEVLPPIGTPKC